MPKTEHFETAIVREKYPGYCARMSESTVTTIEGVTADLSEAVINVVIDEALYPIEALYAAAFTFIDRAYVLLSRGESGFIASLQPKKLDDENLEEVLRRLAGDFSAELLACAYRERLAAANRATLEAITAQAIGGALGPPPQLDLDDLEDFDFTEEPFEDPLGIAMSWEDKYGKKDKSKNGDDEATKGEAQ